MPKVTSSDSLRELSRKGLEIDLLLRAAKGLSDAQANGWWYAGNPHLGGDTPIHVWFSDLECSRADEVAVAARLLP